MAEEVFFYFSFDNESEKGKTEVKIKGSPPPVGTEFRVTIKADIWWWFKVMEHHWVMEPKNWVDDILKSDKPFHEYNCGVYLVVERYLIEDRTKGELVITRPKQ